MKMVPIIEWLKAGDIGFKTYDGVDLAADIDQLPVAGLPACLVVQAVEQMTPSQEGAGLIVIERTIGFDVVSVVSASARRGQDRDELAVLSEAVISRLIGWTPDASIYRPFIPVSAQLLGLGQGRASWITRFRTLDRIRKQG